MASNEVVIVAIHNKVKCVSSLRQVPFVSMLFDHRNTPLFIANISTDQLRVMMFIY